MQEIAHDQTAKQVPSDLTSFYDAVECADEALNRLIANGVSTGVERVLKLAQTMLLVSSEQVWRVTHIGRRPRQ